MIQQKKNTQKKQNKIKPGLISSMLQNFFLFVNYIHLTKSETKKLWTTSLSYPKLIKRSFDEHILCLL